MIIAFVLNSIANIMLKIGANSGIQFSGFNWNSVSANRFFIFGILLFAVNVIFYFLALRNLSLSLAYPIMVGMSFLIINSYAYYFLDDKINLMQILGYLMIVAGIIIVFYFAKR